MKSKNRIRAYHGIVGLALLVLAFTLAISKFGGDEKTKTQTAVAPTPRESAVSTKKQIRTVVQEGPQTVTLKFKVGSLGE